MEVEDQVGTGHAFSGFIYVWIVHKNLGEAGFDDDADFQIRAMLFEEREGGSGEDAVTEGSQTDHGDPRAGRQTV
jgi:hypothetical protein